jgi:hypothetical protein
LRNEIAATIVLVGLSVMASCTHQPTIQALRQECYALWPTTDPKRQNNMMLFEGTVRSLTNVHQGPLDEFSVAKINEAMNLMDHRWEQRGAEFKLACDTEAKNRQIDL